MKTKSERLVNQIKDENGDELYECRNAKCRSVGTIDDFDCMGADDGKVFCNRCGRMQELKPATKDAPTLFD